MSPLVRGDRLAPDARREVLDAFIYRWTSDNPYRAEVYGRCPHCGVAGGKPDMSDAAIPCRQYHPTIALVTDAEWLKTHAFHVTKAGRLHARRKIAESAYMLRDVDGGDNG